MLAPCSVTAHRGSACLLTIALCGVALLTAARAVRAGGDGNTLGDVTVSSDTMWSEDSYEIDSLTVTNGAVLTIAGGSTINVAGPTLVTAAGMILLQGENVDGHVGGEWQGEGVTIDTVDLRVDTGSAISADAQGYVSGQGPGAGVSDGNAHTGSGGGSGGVGGRGGDDLHPGGLAYGDAFAPADLGSGGGATRAPGGRGGGAITVNVLGTLTLDGVISANGNIGANVPCGSAASGGGSGGSIHVTAMALTGTGLLRANGGAGGVGGCFPTTGDDGGGGAGGRIAVLYAQDAGFDGFLASDVSGGIGGGRVAPPGTMVFLDTATNALRISQHLAFAPDTVAHFGAVTLDDAATLDLGGGAHLTVDRDLDVTQGSSILIAGTRRDGEIEGEWRGAGVMIIAPSVHVDAESRIAANAQGYLAGLGPGAGDGDGVGTAGGGGYGGAGGDGNGTLVGGRTYGSASAPLDLGSGGGLAHAAPGDGGGAIRLHTDALQLDGVIVASGGDGNSVGCTGAAPGGGSGGSILIVTRTLDGGGSLHADGGAGGEGGCTGSGDDGGGGGGGRIAVHYNVDQGFAGVTSSSVDGGRGGADRAGAPGTLLFIGCAGDCNGDGRVTVDELVHMVNIALGRTDVLACLAGDHDHDGTIVVNEIVAAVNRALTSC